MKPGSLLLLLGSTVIGLTVLCGPPVRVTRAQFSKFELDSFGYPTNSALAMELGRSEARRDLTNGVVKLPMYGLPAVWSGEFDRILAEKYHVSRFGLAGCLISESLVAYANGYSEVSRRFIEERHGTNLWKEVQAEAEKAFGFRAVQEAGATSGKEPVPGETYRVKPGDTLGKIAQRQRMTLKALQAANPGVDPNRLKVHQMLRLPAGTKLSEKP